MKFLLDAHALLWFLAGDSKLSAKALACVQDGRNILFVSPATLWEIGICGEIPSVRKSRNFLVQFQRER